MSPLMSPLPAQAAGWVPPAGWTVAQFQYLCNIDTDAVVQTDIEYVNDYCTFWLADRASNQPVRANGMTFDPRKPEIGYANFSRGPGRLERAFSDRWRVGGWCPLVWRIRNSPYLGAGVCANFGFNATLSTL
jgi:hypothetical protein